MKIDLVELGVVRIRRATLKDARAVRQLFIDAPFVGNGNPDGYQLEDVRAYILRDLVLVAISGKEAVGAMWDIKYPRHLVGGACGVRPDYERCGVYRGLAEYRLRFAKAHKIKYLETATVTGNRRMETLFARHGYARCSTVTYFSKDL